MLQAKRDALLQFIGYQQAGAGARETLDEALDAMRVDTPRSLAARGAVEAAVLDPRLSERYFAELRVLREALARDPAGTLHAAPAYLGARPSIQAGLELLDTAERALQAAPATFAAVRASHSADDPFELPASYQFEGYDPAEIPIYPWQTKFETVADAVVWVLTAAAAWFFRLTHHKPDLPRHTDYASNFVYDLPAADATFRIALFSDWGTGYYHSQYIAKHIGRLKPDVAVHLGDVYYTGTQAEFANHVSAFIEPYLLPNSAVFALNANHEMDYHGMAYFDFLRRKRELGQATAMVDQPQEGSYFCLRSDRCQVIGIDTAYEQSGRHRYRHHQINPWLRDRLQEGRRQGRINILLSQHEPYGAGKTRAEALLRTDLGGIALLVDLWFWGDEHYCGLYHPAAAAPFYGSCIGHGGYPYRRCAVHGASGLTEVIWAERSPRFPSELGLGRDALGNNGFCLLTVTHDAVRLSYIDWRFQTRYEIDLPLTGFV